MITAARVSRDHAEIKAEGAGFVLVDVGSSSGTFVNSEKVQRHKLKFNDRVEFGSRGGPYFVFNPTSAERVDLLRELSATARISIFSRLNKVDIEELTKIISARTYGADAAVFFQGDPSDSLYMLLAGLG